MSQTLHERLIFIELNIEILAEWTLMIFLKLRLIIF